MLLRFMRPSLLLTAALSWGGCGGEDSTVGPDGEGEGQLTEASLAQVSEVFAVSCAFSGCHSGGEPAAGLLLEGDFAARIVGVASEQRSDLKLVDPGNPNKSYLLIKVARRRRNHQSANAAGQSVVRRAGGDHPRVDRQWGKE